MADTSAIRAGRAFVEIFADSTKLESALKNIGRKFTALGSMVAGWGKSMLAIGAAVLAPMIGLAKVTASMGDEFNKMSARTGVSVETLSEWAYAATLGGSSADALENGLRKMQKTLLDARMGLSTAVDALNVLGISMSELESLSPEDQFKRIGDAISKIPDPSVRAGVAMEIFGRSGTALLPMLAKGAAGLEEVQKQARALGLTISTESAQAAADFTDKMSELWFIIKKAGFDIGSVLLPPLTDAANIIERLVSTSMKWLKENKEVVVITLAIGAALVTAGAALYVFGTALVWSVGVVSAIGSAISTAWAAIAAVGGAIATVFTSPVLAAVAAVAVLGGTIAWASGAGGKALDWLGERFSELKGFATEAFHGIADAMMAGDIQLAANILWVSLRIAWREGVDKLSEIWEGFKTGFKNTLAAIFAGALAATAFGVHALTNAWIKAIDTITKAWIGLQNIIANKQQDILGSAVKVYEHIRKRFGLETVSDAEVDKYTNEQKNKTDKSAQSDLAGNRSQTDADLAAEKALHTKTLKSIVDAFGPGDSNNPTAAQDDAELTKLKAELAALLEKAKGERARFPAGNLPGAGSPPGFVSGLDHAEKKVFGTFSASAARVSGGGAPLDKIAEATKNTATNTKGMFDLLKNFDNTQGL